MKYMFAIFVVAIIGTLSVLTLKDWNWDQGELNKYQTTQSPDPRWWYGSQ